MKSEFTDLFKVAINPSGDVVVIKFEQNSPVFNFNQNQPENTSITEKIVDVVSLTMSIKTAKTLCRTLDTLLFQTPDINQKGGTDDE